FFVPIPRCPHLSSPQAALKGDVDCSLYDLVQGFVLGCRAEYFATVDSLTSFSPFSFIFSPLSFLFSLSPFTLPSFSFSFCFIFFPFHFFPFTFLLTLFLVPPPTLIQLFIRSLPMGFQETNNPLPNQS